jgi:hypothetical protein
MSQKCTTQLSGSSTLTLRAACAAPPAPRSARCRTSGGSGGSSPAPASSGSLCPKQHWEKKLLLVAARCRCFSAWLQIGDRHGMRLYKSHSLRRKGVASQMDRRLPRTCPSHVLCEHAAEPADRRRVLQQRRHDAHKLIKADARVPVGVHLSHRQHTRGNKHAAWQAKPGQLVRWRHSSRLCAERT